MAFARWQNFDACQTEQMQIGHNEEIAKEICLGIQERAEKGVLFKSLPPLEILKTADDELVVGGYASWEMVDEEKDYVTTEAMVNFLAKFFKLPPEYRNISIDHTNFQMATALLHYPEEDPKYFSHVHEKGMYLIAKVRNDKLRRTQHYREQIQKGIYKMYSISGEPIRCDGPCEHSLRINKDIRKIFDIDPFEVAIVKEGMNRKAGPLERLSKQKTDLQKPFANYSSHEDCVEQNQGKVSDPHAFCAWLEHRTTGKWPAEKILKEFAKMTWEECIAQARANPDVDDPEKLCAWLRWYGPHGQKKGRDLTFQQETERIFRKHFPEYGDE